MRPQKVALSQAQKALNEQNGFSLQRWKQSRDRSVATAIATSTPPATGPHQNRFYNAHRARPITRLDRGLGARIALGMARTKQTVRKAPAKKKSGTDKRRSPRLKQLAAKEPEEFDDDGFVSLYEREHANINNNHVF